jgi:hypothetical protein
MSTSSNGTRGVLFTQVEPLCLQAPKEAGVDQDADSGDEDQAITPFRISTADMARMMRAGQLVMVALVMILAFASRPSRM